MALGIEERRRQGQGFTIADPQDAVHPYFTETMTVVTKIVYK